MANDLQTVMEELTVQPSTENPFLSVYLDWQPDGTGKRQSLQILEQEFDRIDRRLPAHGPQRESFDADRQRILDHVNTGVPDEARGVAIFACSADDVWRALSLQVPIETHIVEDRYPHLFNLARVLDDYETYAVVLVDSQESRIFVVSLNEAEQRGGSEAAEKIRRFDAGGWAQMLFQRRIDNVIKAHTRDMADQLGRVMRRHNVQHVILAGNDSIKGAVRDSLPQQMQEKVVDFISLDIRSSMEEILQAIEPLMRDVERRQEADDVDSLEAEANTIGGLGVVGVEGTAMALSKGQVRHLIMLANFQAAGSLNPSNGFLYGGMNQKDPYDGTELEQVDLREAFTARAAGQGATIQIVDSSEYLDQHEGVGALLWYRDDVEQPQQIENQSSMQRGG